MSKRPYLNDAIQRDVARLLKWFDLNKREMPWRGSTDPYAIWVSEIMLQQTRVDQATPYFEGFMRKFPNVHALAMASSDELMKAWEGLGYYSRARNLQEAAKTIVKEFGGNLPTTYAELIDLKGIGPYTAAAVSSIAFNQAHAAIDGNVIRVVTRYFGITENVLLMSTKKDIERLANEMLDSSRPGDFNQAMMELGAKVCSPTKPSCNECPLNEQCMYFTTAMTEPIPYKPKKKKLPHKNIGVGVLFNKNGAILIARRKEEGLLGGLWEFPGGKQEEGESIEACLHREFLEEIDVELDNLEFLIKVDHAYSHFKVSLHVFTCTHKSGIPKALASDQIKWVSLFDLDNYAFPKANHAIIHALNEKFPTGKMTKWALNQRN